MSIVSKKTVSSLALYLCCYILVLGFVNTYGLYQFLNEQFGRSVFLIIPILLPLLLFTTLPILIQKIQKRTKVKKQLLVSGTLLCLLALMLPAAHLPIKRIHVAEYLLLSLLVRYALARTINGGPGLLFFSANVTLLLGIHDEFLQGLHPLRTFGLRDMLVNGLSGIGGSLIWHGLHLFSHPAPTDAGLRQSGFDDQLPLLFWLSFSVPALAIPTTAYLNTAQPFWPSIPLLASGAFLLISPNKISAQLLHGIRLVHFFAITLVVYPLAAHWTGASFW